MTFSVATAAAADTGFPPKVEAWDPTVNEAAIF